MAQPTPEVDIVVLGGGCAGLSLALALAKLPPESQPTVAILEARPAYSADRTWCFWHTEATRAQGCEALVTHHWPRLRLADSQRSLTVDYSASPYVMVNALSFYNHAAIVIARSATTTLSLDQTVSHCQASGGAWIVHTANQTWRCKAIIDTRPLAAPVVGGALLWQSFCGIEVECEQAVFDPDCADLMDFSAPAADTSGRITFTYVLPTSNRRALIELTVFAPEPLAPAALADELEAAILKRTRGTAFARLRSEHSVLPMGNTQRLAPAPPGYVYAGLTAGAARPATGYAFVRIQRWALACAQSWQRTGSVIGHAPDSWLQSQMDALFLQVIRAHPVAAPEIFLNLFERAGGARMARFLSDQASFLDRAAIVAALPSAPFLTQLAYQLLRRSAAHKVPV